ncbi:type V CRISPR-associated endonuclease Cas1 [bacterium]|nr:type V CRISPR-associated endonuclease Cas1 [bacterium]
MLFLDDFKEKKILLIHNNQIDDGLRFRNENIVFEKNGVVVNQISCHKVFCIFIIGDLTLTSVFIKNSLDFGVSIFLLKNNLECYAYMGARAEGNYLLRERQYKADYEQELKIAKKLVENKLINQLLLIKSIDKKFNYKEEKKNIISRVIDAKDEKELLGVEGNYSKIFFKNYFKDLRWYKRMPRVKIDEYNILLDIGYTFLFNFIDSLLMLYGFDTYKGFYHKLFFQRKSLSCDIMEPFRCLIDKQLLKSFNLGQIDKKDFKVVKGIYRLDYNKSRKYTKIFLDTITDNKEEIFRYIYNFYRYQTNPEKFEFPNFSIK